ncbi:MAG: UDP-N-acetylmuramate--L-alanine ligase [candidate division BRC1 bacterium ADurb.BinA292]|nr:MAG: UDP-N-acetylmuramate--L-alanine ligase [candidate division BRC1 bacterium ADurb.BinA292]
MDDLRQFQRIHFIGIGGVGMSAIATVLLHHGFTVSGSDRAKSAATLRLQAAGARIFHGHEAANIDDADLVVVSTAIRPDNPELVAAREQERTIWHRSQALACIMRMGRSIAISGTHGKTTTTALLGLMLTEAGCDPTVVIGGSLPNFGGANARCGNGPWVVVEADESDASFLRMDPDRILISNIEADHLDFYSDQAAVEAAFKKFLGRLRDGGRMILCIDDPALAALARIDEHHAITYALADSAAEMHAAAVETIDGGLGSRFTPVWRGQALDPVELHVPGRHNVQNALGALACALEIGADYEGLRRGLAEFVGAGRRFQFKGVCGDIAVYDDYAHHPTEIAATLAAARAQIESGRAARLVAVFQPHRFTRTQHLADQFGDALDVADVAVVTEVYSAGENPIAGVSGRLIHDRLLALGHRSAQYLPTLDEVRAGLAEIVMPGDLVLTLGAGNIWQVGEGLLAELRERSAELA